MDVSVVINESNPSIDKCIKYCLDRNVFCEKVSHAEEGSGKYICIPDPMTYYHEYYIHLCWLGLNHQNIIANKYEIPSIVVYDQKNEEFYMGKHQNVFYRRQKGFRGPSFTLKKGSDQVIMGCTLKLLEELPQYVPDDDNLLNYYHNYFLNE